MTMQVKEDALVFNVGGEQLLGILHSPLRPRRRGVVLVVGGPQYRVGSHRQFVLLARELAAAGIPVLRFDYRGMGDSSGELHDFAMVSQDIRTAVDTLLSRQPEVEEVVLWGLCDAASACAFYAAGDPRVTGLALLNPWIRTEAGEAKALVRHYYSQRLMSRDFWRKLFSGGVAIGRAWRGFAGARATARQSSGTDQPLPARMLQGLQAFRGRCLLVLAGNDLVASEFKDHIRDHAQWQRWIEQETVVRRDLADADHTFSSRAWRTTVSRWTCEWVLTS